MAFRFAGLARRASRVRDAAGTSGPVLTTVLAVLLSLSVVPRIADDHLFGAGSPRLLLVSALPLLVGRGLYLLFRHRS
jgi:hypothetical protein